MKSISLVNQKYRAGQAARQTMGGVSVKQPKEEAHAKHRRRHLLNSAGLIPLEFTRQPCSVDFKFLAALYYVPYVCQQVIISRRSRELSNITLEYERLLQEIHSYKYDIALLNKTLTETQNDYKALRFKMEAVEMRHAQQNVAESSSYEDAAPSPPLLQAACDSVRASIASFASDLYKHVRQYLRHDLSFDFMQDSSVAISPINSKLCLQALCCRTLFHGFEDALFLMDHMLQFEKRGERKKRLFKDYQTCKLSEPQELLLTDPLFHQFLYSKMDVLILDMEKVLFSSNESIQIHDILIQLFHNLLSMSFCRLGKMIWLLHKLTFAFDPTAEIFRVAPGSMFDEEYMDDVIQVCVDYEVDDAHQLSPNNRKSNKVVTLMCVPGFTIRNTIVKSQVCLH